MEAVLISIIVVIGFLFFAITFGLGIASSDKREKYNEKVQKFKKDHLEAINKFNGICKCKEHDFQTMYQQSITNCENYGKSRKDKIDG